MDRIARQAKISKRMLFYYFKSKQGLFEVVIQSAWQKGEILQVSPKSAVDMLPFWTTWYMDNPEWTKLLGWEGLEWENRSIPQVRTRRTYWKRALTMVRAEVGPGKWPSDLDPRYILFGLIAMEMAPVLFPNLAYLIIERDTNDPQFKKEWISFMSRFSRILMRTDLVSKHNP
jgi:AcrR family transcriptional regulator